MITHDQQWSLTRGNTPVPSRWKATKGAQTGLFRTWEPVEHRDSGPGGLHGREQRVASATMGAAGTPASHAARLMPGHRKKDRA